MRLNVTNKGVDGGRREFGVGVFDSVYLGICEPQMARLDADLLIAEAEKETGLSDWGEDDFRGALVVLVRAAETEGEMTTLGRERIRTWLAMLLEQRLKMMEDRKRIPQIAEQIISKPVFIMGLPRAGTTFLHRLMSLHPDMLTTRWWELFLPSPPPNDASVDHSPQIARMDEFMEYQGWYSPDVMRAHTHHPEEPEEDMFATFYSMVSRYFTGYLNVPSYVEYIDSRGSDDSFLWHRRVLQAIQYGTRGKRFMLKAPGHTLHVPQLLEHYPDAFLIQSHRDPSRVIASVFSNMSATRSKISDREQQIGRDEALDFMDGYVRGLMVAARQRSELGMADRFFDVHYLDFVRDPLACVKETFRHADLECTPELEDSIVDWTRKNRKGKYGKHRYALSDHGLTQDDVWKAFKPYLDTFDIEQEPATAM